MDTWDTQTDCQLTVSLLSTKFAVAEFEQQDKNLPIEHKSLNNILRRENSSPANAKANADHVESKLEIPEKVTSDLFEENKEVKQQLEEATYKAKSLQSELCEASKTNILLKENIDDYDLASKIIQEYWTKKSNH